MKLKKHQYNIEMELNAPIDTCFEAAINEKIMQEWIPDVEKIVYDHSAATAPYHEGSVRHITMPNGSVIKERINLYQPPYFCGYEIDAMGGITDRLFSNYKGLMCFEVIDDNTTRFIWQGNFDCVGLQKITEPLARIMVRKVMYKMADNIKGFFAHA